MSNFGISVLIAVGFSLSGAICIIPAGLSIAGSRYGWLKTRKGHGNPVEQV